MTRSADHRPDSTINQLHEQITALVKQHGSHLLAERGLGSLVAGKLIGEIAGIERFATDAKLARMAGCAPIPVSSGRTDRHRLDRGGNRQLNHAIHVYAICRIRHDPQTAIYIAKQSKAGKTNAEATRWLKHHLVRRIHRPLEHPHGRLHLMS